MTQKINWSDPEFLNELPENVFEFGRVLGYDFNRYYIDLDKCRIIMKTKRGNKIKVVKPHYDKWNNTYYVWLYRVSGTSFASQFFQS